MATLGSQASVHIQKGREEENEQEIKQEIKWLNVKKVNEIQKCEMYRMDYIKMII